MNKTTKTNKYSEKVSEGLKKYDRENRFFDGDSGGKFWLFTIRIGMLR